ncbi:MAG: dTDP-4-dehydrorhamnose reductase [Gammaproteobacteria bacterium]
MRAPCLLILGREGQVGWELERCVVSLGKVIAVGLHTAPLSVNLADKAAVRDLVRSVKPDWILNAAAYTAVDRAESEPDLALAVNGEAPGVLAEEARRGGAVLVHYSTDYVFDGTANRPYVETDQTSPLNVYGQTKLAGERAIQAVGERYLIFRTTWVYGARGHNFLLAIQRLARERDELRIVADQIGAPTWSRFLAQTTAHVVAVLERNRDRIDEVAGTYHVTNVGQTSWHGFAEAIVAHMRERHALGAKRVLPIATEDYPTPARRPKYSILDNTKAEQTFGISCPTWEQALTLCLAQQA